MNSFENIASSLVENNLELDFSTEDLSVRAEIVSAGIYIAVVIHIELCMMYAG